MMEEKPARRVAVFGGSFDPVHTGHIEIASAARDRHALDAVIFVPARRQPHKPSPPVAPGPHRLAMIERAIRGRPGFSVSDCELARPGKSYTVDTMIEFRRRFGSDTDLFFLLGADSVAELPAWKDLGTLTQVCTLIIAVRPGWSLDVLDALAPHVGRERLAAIRKAVVRTTRNPVSATEIRRRLAAGESVEGLVPEPVRAYIAENKLYTGPQS